MAAGAETPEFPRRKNRYRQAEGELPTGSHDEQIVVLSSLLASLMERKDAAAEPPAKEAKIFRFKDKKPAAPEKPPLPDATVPPAPIRPASRAESAALPPAGSVIWRTPAEPNAPGYAPNLLVYWALLLVAMGAAFLAGRWTSGNASAAPAAELSATAPTTQTATWSEQDVAQLDRVLEADQAGDLDKASQLAKTLEAHSGRLPGLEAYLNLIVARKQRYADAESSISRLISPGMEGEQMVLAENALGFTYARERRFPLASESFKHSTLAAPFEAENFRIWGESLRREGHMEQAIAAFNEALARYPIGPVENMDMREYVAYKIRLSRIEGNLPVEPRSEAAELTATANSAGYWFLSDAALALQQGNGAAGAAALEKAKAALPAALFNRLLEDYYFRAYANLPQIAAFLSPASAGSMQTALRPREVYFIDP